jgi:hypothetical protein
MKTARQVSPLPWPNYIRATKMKNSASLACRTSSKKRLTAPIEIDIRAVINGTQCTAAYIAELTGELATLANGMRLANLSRLLAAAKLEAEYWSQRGR